MAAGALAGAAPGAAPQLGNPSPSTLGAAPPAPAPLPGWGYLWNGRNLEGWTVTLKDPAVDPKTVWSVSEGVLHLTGVPYGYLRTVRTYGNYWLHVEWRYPAAGSPKSNSGVFVHVHGPDRIWPAGIECQLQAGNAGQLIGTEVDLPGAPVIRGKARADRIRPSSEKPFGEWNTYDIFCRDQIVEVWVNGVMQNRFDRIAFKSDASLHLLRGSICLQLEGAPIDFRNLWIEGLR